jgi:peptidyl-tRNA hydrolase
MKKKILKKRHWKMSAAELGKATSEFDADFSADSFRPQTAADRARWARAKRKSGKSGAKTIAVSVEKNLLHRTERLAKSQGLARDALIDRALKTVLAANGEKVS